MIVEEAIRDKAAFIQMQLAADTENVFGIEYLELHREKVVARMPVTTATKTPFGVLHGGASVYLAETVASLGAWLNVTDPDRRATGIEINANHIRSAHEGWVLATAEPIHRGKSTHVWQVKIVNESEGLISICRCTILIV